MSGPWTQVAKAFEQQTKISLKWERARKIVTECASNADSNAATVDYQSGNRSAVQTSELRAASERLARKWNLWKEEDADSKCTDAKKRARMASNDKEVGV